MGLRARLRGLERTARGRLAWLDLPDGRSFYYDPEATGAALFLFAANVYRAVRQGAPLPEVPEVLRVIGGLPTSEARERALDAVYGGASIPFIAYNWERFLATGEVVPDERIKRKTSDRDTPDQGGDVRIGRAPE